MIGYAEKGGVEVTSLVVTLLPRAYEVRLNTEYIRQDLDYPIS